MKSTCERLRNEVFAQNDNIHNVYQTLRELLSGVDVLYLPTYRRIESPLIEEVKSPYSRSRKKPKIQFAVNSLFTTDIEFGLADIQDRIAQLNQEILQKSNLGYRRISANIINELLNRSHIQESLNTQLPSRDDLTLFFSRLEDGRFRDRFEPQPIPDIDKIYSGLNRRDETGKFLGYFLNKLYSVIDETRDIESVLEEFIKGCNKYLSSQDEVSDLGRDQIISGRSGLDDKELFYDRKTLSVHVVSRPTGRKIPLDYLSSGEKQMISLLAKLLLYPKDKLVLIDEPELSLSLEWQRQILVDILNAPLCKQVIAITHSPFVFDNDLEPFARSLKLNVDLSRVNPQGE